jgi:hypothetical protein
MPITQESAKKMSTDSLLYVRKDLQEVIHIQERSNAAGYHTPKLSVYLDELSAVGFELARRRGLHDCHACGRPL